jgi:hypothetical protein
VARHRQRQRRWKRRQLHLQGAQPALAEQRLGLEQGVGQLMQRRVGVVAQHQLVDLLPQQIVRDIGQLHLDASDQHGGQSSCCCIRSPEVRIQGDAPAAWQACSSKARSGSSVMAMLMSTSDRSSARPSTTDPDTKLSSVLSSMPRCASATRWARRRRSLDAAKLGAAEPGVFHRILVAQRNAHVAAFNLYRPLKSAGTVSLSRAGRQVVHMLAVA